MPTEAPEAILNQRDDNGKPLPSGALSVTEIEVLDLISEGEVGGLISGEYTYSGNLGEIGWQTSTFTPFPDAPNLPGVKFLRSIYWNEVPVVNSANKYNFQKIDVSFTRGKAYGENLNSKIPELTVSRTIGERLRGSEVMGNEETPIPDKDNTKTYRIYNPDCNGVIVNIKVTSLASNNINTGDTNTAKVEYKIYYKPVYASTNQSIVSSFVLGALDSIEGKTNYGYVKSTRVNFFPIENAPHTLIGWEIMIIRVTPESLNNQVRNQTIIDSLTEIYSDKFSYPNSAIVRSKFDAQFFSQVPSRAFDIELLKVKIPSNYEPRTRTYIEGDNGWDGTFAEQKQWTNNPCWCHYDLLTNKRYGLGKYLPDVEPDKWSLYEIAKYCDTLVSDGYGNLEPRFTCNLILNSRDDAYKVINDMASIFRAITYYGNGTIFAVQDSPKTPIVQFTNADVENGNFAYESSSKRNRHTVAVVRYNDKTNFYKPAIEYVPDVNGIRRYGVRELDLTAFGCTSRGQAVRLGRWALLSETLETETVKFVAGLKGAYIKPGDAFQVFDSNRKSLRYAGRTLDIDTNSNNALMSGIVGLDDAINLSQSRLYKLTLEFPTYYLDTTNISDLRSVDSNGIRQSQLHSYFFSGFRTGVYDSNKTEIHLTGGFGTDNFALAKNGIWAIEPADGILTKEDSNNFLDKNYDWFRAVNIVEKDTNQYEIFGLQYSPDKYAKIESGLDFQRPVSSYLIKPAAPSSITLSIPDQTSINKPVVDYFLTVPNYSGLTSYKVFAKTGDFDEDGQTAPDDKWMIGKLPYTVTNDTYVPAYVDTYYFRAYGFNDEANLISDACASGSIQVNAVYPVKDIQIHSLMLVSGTGTNTAGTRLTGEYFVADPTFVWQVGSDWDSTLASQFKYRITIRAPSPNNIPSSTIYYEDYDFEAPPTDLRFVFDFDKNTSAIDGPHREFDVVVEAIDSNGLTSAGNTKVLPGSYRAWAPNTVFSTSAQGGQPDKATNGNGRFFTCILTHTSASSQYSSTKTLNDETYWSEDLDTEVWNMASPVFNNQGYDILAINNARISGFYLSTGGMGIGGYHTRNWMNPNGTIYSIFQTGTVPPPDTVGGFMYSSTGLLSGLEWITGHRQLAIHTGEFSFDAKGKNLFVPTNWSNIKTGYFAVSLYDSFDYVLRQEERLVASGLYISNTTSVIPSGSVKILDVLDQLTVYNFGNLNERASYITTRDSNSNWVSKVVDENGAETIISSKRRGT